MTTLWNALTGRDLDSATLRLLGETEIFEDFTMRELETLYRFLHEREYLAGETIFKQGEPGLGLYIIVRGKISIRDEYEGRELTELGGGHFFGEIALLNQIIRSATARASTDTLLLGLFQPGLFDLLERHPKLGVKLLLALSQSAGMRIVELSEEVAEARRAIKQLREEARIA
ncbi:cyclic nucleotide-binding domain-containing protein [soil metagenome]